MPGCFQADCLKIFIQLVALPPGFVIRFWNLDIGPFCQKPDRLRITALFDIHDETNDIATFMAAKTKIDLLDRRDAERWRIFFVERTKAEKIAAAFPVKADILLDDRNEFIAGFDFFDNSFRD
jgi:hypothetical protein